MYFFPEPHGEFDDQDIVAAFMAGHYRIEPTPSASALRSARDVVFADQEAKRKCRCRGNPSGHPKLPPGFAIGLPIFGLQDAILFSQTSSNQTRSYLPRTSTPVVDPFESYSTFSKPLVHNHLTASVPKIVAVETVANVGYPNCLVLQAQTARTPRLF